MLTPLLLETIKIKDGNIYNLIYHQKRCDMSRLHIFHSKEALSLKDTIQAPPKGLWRCRILYNKEIHSVEYIPYVEKNIHILKIISSPINYAFKYANRDDLNMLLKLEKNVDEVIIEKKGYLRDTTISNIAFYDGEQWFTPTHPLLKGTMRERLLDQGFLQTKEIQKENLSEYTQVALMNAMIGFKILKNITISDTKGKHYDY